MKAEISQSMLKLSSNEDISEFTARILNFFNPKFESPSEEELASADIYLFASRCELTADEFLLALSLATEGKLKSEIDKDGNAETIKLFREIDIIKLGEVKAAYIRYKNDDEQYKKGKSDIKAFLNPPLPEPTPEEKKAQFNKFLKEEYSRLQKKGQVLGTTTFYDLIRKDFEVVKLGFVEKFLKEFKHEVFQDENRSLEFHLASSKKVIKKDVFLSFKELFITKYIEKEKLKELSELDWILYWEKFNH